MKPHRGMLTGPKQCSQSQRNGPEVSFAPNQGEEDNVIRPAMIATGHQALNQKRASRSFDMIIGSLAGDDDVVDVAFAQAGAGDAHESRLLLQLENRGAAQVSHAGAQAAHEL